MTCTILSIEDPSSFRQMIRLALEFEGFEVVDAQSGAVGLETARSLMPDLILLDVNLPDTDGLTICKEILADKRLMLIPVVMLSSSNDEVQIEAGIRAGAKGYLVKPFYPKELVALAHRLIPHCTV
jgi:two-component system alkaline phosphatase synthesis response regulator PhoP